jgi:tRNA-Thr(GGU) m(6)t(6)A37 methyltransferase TsaA
LAGRVDGYEVRVVGRVSSPLTDPSAAPRQGDEGGPEADLVFDPAVEEALRELASGSEVELLTWLHKADRTTLVVHPRGDLDRPEQGVFTTRSPDRPNPIGLHRVRVVSVDGTTVHVAGLEAVDGTPILDVKPVLEPVADR